MPSKESLERSREWLKRDPAFAYFAECHSEAEREEMVLMVADLLDEAIREAGLKEAEWWANELCDDSNCSECKRKRDRLAQLREGKP